MKGDFGPGGSDPVNLIRWVAAATISANAWNPNYVMSAELRLLEFSILRQGWIQPILISAGRILIDGFHRWRLSQDSAKIRDRYNGLVPAVTLDITEPEAKLLTVRINRAKGTNRAARLSAIVKEVIDSGFSPDEVAREIGASRAEVDLLYTSDLFDARGIKDYRYSQAWVPVINPERQ